MTSVAPIATARRTVRPRRNARTTRKTASAAAALTGASLFTAPEMNANIGWNATNSPAATAGQYGRGNSSPTSITANAAVRPPNSAVISRIAVKRDQIDSPSVAR